MREQIEVLTVANQAITTVDKGLCPIYLLWPLCHN